MIEVNPANGMSVQKAIGSELDLSENNTITVTADQINVVADDIDLSGNTSIKLTAGQVNDVIAEVNLNANGTITLMAGNITTAQNTANTAQSTANDAKSTADNAKNTAGDAQTAAGNAQNTANEAKVAANDAGAAAAAAVESIGEIPNHVEIASGGVYVKDEKGASALKLNSGSVSIGTVSGTGKGFSQLSANYVQFANYQLRRTSDGGLAFKLTEV